MESNNDLLNESIETEKAQIKLNESGLKPIDLTQKLF